MADPAGRDETPSSLPALTGQLLGVSITVPPDPTTPAGDLISGSGTLYWIPP